MLPPNNAARIPPPVEAASPPTFRDISNSLGYLENLWLSRECKLPNAATEDDIGEQPPWVQVILTQITTVKNEIKDYQAIRDELQDIKAVNQALRNELVDVKADNLAMRTDLAIVKASVGTTQDNVAAINTTTTTEMADDTTALVTQAPEFPVLLANNNAGPRTALPSNFSISK